MINRENRPREVAVIYGGRLDATSTMFVGMVANDPGLTINSAFSEPTPGASSDDVQEESS